MEEKGRDIRWKRTKNEKGGKGKMKEERNKEGRERRKEDNYEMEDKNKRLITKEKDMMVSISINQTEGKKR